MTNQEKAIEEVKAFKWMISKGYDRKASKDIAQILVKYKEEQLRLHVVGSTSCELSKEQLKRKIQMADMQHQIKRERT